MDPGAIAGAAAAASMMGAAASNGPPVSSEEALSRLWRVLAWLLFGVIALFTLLSWMGGR